MAKLKKKSVDPWQRWAQRTIAAQSARDQAKEQSREQDRRANEPYRVEEPKLHHGSFGKTLLGEQDRRFRTWQTI